MLVESDQQEQIMQSKPLNYLVKQIKLIESDSFTHRNDVGSYITLVTAIF